MHASELPTEANESATIRADEDLLPIQTSPTSPGDSDRDGQPFAERYARAGQIGSGGMGEIFLAKDRTIGRSIALKRLHSGLNSKSAPERFIREARIQGQLEHPSIVPVYDLGSDRDGAAYFTMRHIRGRTLEALLRALRAGEPAVAQYTRRKLLTLFTTICLTLHYAHSRGVLHRDIKPANVMVGEFGEVYVLDWGIAKIAGQEETIDLSPSELGPSPAPSPQMTAAGSVMGTLGYMPPEQLRGDLARMSPRSDVYALGMLFFELLTFERCHRTDDPRVAMQRTLYGFDDLPSLRDPSVPPELDQIFSRATALDPQLRFDSARALCDAVEQFLDGDRDLSRRRELAEGHAARAAELAAQSLSPGEPAASQSRLKALREITQALALDPEQHQARSTLGRLLTEMPSVMPPEVKAAMDRSTHEAQMNGLRFGSLIYLSWIAVIAYVLFMGVKSWVAFTGPTVGVVLILIHVSKVFIRKSFSALDRKLLAVLTFLTIASFSVWLGPFVLVPLATACGALVFSVQSSRGERWFYLAVATIASGLPYFVEWLHIFPPAYEYRPEGLLLMARAVHLSPTWTTLGLVYLSLSFTFVPAYYLGRVRDSLASAEAKLFLHAWHFEHLTGSAPDPKAQPKP